MHLLEFGLSSVDLRIVVRLFGTVSAGDWLGWVLMEIGWGLRGIAGD